MILTHVRMRSEAEPLQEHSLQFDVFQCSAAMTSYKNSGMRLGCIGGMKMASISLITVVKACETWTGGQRPWSCSAAQLPTASAAQWHTMSHWPLGQTEAIGCRPIAH